jgi:hypothetical protein
MSPFEKELFYPILPCSDKSHGRPYRLIVQLDLLLVVDQDLRIFFRTAEIHHFQKGFIFLLPHPIQVARVNGQAQVYPGERCGGPL